MLDVLLCADPEHLDLQELLHRHFHQLALTEIRPNLPRLMRHALAHREVERSDDAVRGLLGELPDLVVPKLLVVVLDFGLVRALVVLEEDVRHDERVHLHVFAVLQADVRERSELLEVVEGAQLLEVRGSLGQLKVRHDA